MAVNTGSAGKLSPRTVHFSEATEFMRSKVRLPTRAWTDLWQDMHSRAFVVAGAMTAELVADFHEAVTSAIAEGKTLADFRRDFDDIVARHGWSYNGSRGWRSRVIFQTNMRSAYSAGRWNQAQRLKSSRPYLRYVHVDPQLAQENSREDHAAWHDLVLPVDHPFWKTFAPPNGWGCRCYFQSLSARDVERLDLKVAEEAPEVPRRTYTVNTPEGPVQVDGFESVAPGFAHNPGLGAFGRGAGAQAARLHGGFTPLEAPGAAARRQSLGALPAQSTRTRPRPVGKEETAIRRALSDAVGSDEAIFTDPAGGHVAITQGLADHLIAKPNAADLGRAAYWPFIRELVESPQEIWVGFARDEASGRVHLRRRYVKVVQLTRDRLIALVGDEGRGHWQALTFFSGRTGPQLARVRQGVLVYREGDES